MLVILYKGNNIWVVTLKRHYKPTNLRNEMLVAYRWNVAQKKFYKLSQPVKRKHNNYYTSTYRNCHLPFINTEQLPVQTTGAILIDSVTKDRRFIN